jgi:hypothetical protein
LDGIGIGFEDEAGDFTVAGGGMAGFDATMDAFLAIEAGSGELGDEGCKDIGSKGCFWDKTDAVRETGIDLEGSIVFASPEKAIGDIGFGDFISGFGFWGLIGAGDGVRNPANT